MHWWSKDRSVKVVLKPMEAAFLRAMESESHSLIVDGRKEVE